MSGKSLVGIGIIERLIGEEIRGRSSKYVGPCHCTGENAKQLFQRVYGENSIHAGAGKVLKINDLK